MSKGPEQQRLSSVERANLVAYLDGELAEPESRALATKLTQSTSARREVEALQKTWELLDFLDRPQASDSLTQRTLAEVDKLSVDGGRIYEAASATFRNATLWATLLVGLCVCFYSGLAFTRSLWPDPTNRLVRDLSIAEHLDEYRDVETIEFLEALDRSPEFAAESPR